MKQLTLYGFGCSPFPPGNKWSAVDAIDGVPDSLAQFLRRGDARIVLGKNTKAKRPSGRRASRGLVSSGLWAEVIVANDLYRGPRRVNGLEAREICHELAGAMSFLGVGVDDAVSRSIPSR